MTFRHIFLPGILLVYAAGAEGQNSEAMRDKAPLQIPNAHYVVVNESIVVNAPVEKVWARVGGFCDITEWMNSPEWEDCKYLQGNGGPG